MTLEQAQRDPQNNVPSPKLERRPRSPAGPRAWASFWVAPSSGRTASCVWHSPKGLPIHMLPSRTTFCQKETFDYWTQVALGRGKHEHMCLASSSRSSFSFSACSPEVDAHDQKHPRPDDFASPPLNPHTLPCTPFSHCTHPFPTTHRARRSLAQDPVGPLSKSSHFSNWGRQHEETHTHQK